MLETGGMMGIKSCFYLGNVMHRRLRPKHHRLQYRVFSLLLDLDEAEELNRKLRFFSLNRFNLLGFRASDHGGGQESTDDLKAHVIKVAKDAGIERPICRVELLCYPRVLGYVFNPLSVYFCYGNEGRLLATLYEVGNTFAERHTYVLGANDCSQISQRAEKVFYVSPFIAKEGAYRFRIRPPAQDEAGVEVSIQHSDKDGPILFAAFKGRRRPFTDRQVVRLWLKHPLMTMKVVAAIHWEALHLWRKRVPWHRHRVKTVPEWTTGTEHSKQLDGKKAA